MDYPEILKNKVNEICPVSNAFVDEFLQIFKLEKFDKNDYYSRKGAFSEKVSFVCKGVFRIFYTNNSGDEWNKHFVIENEFISGSISKEKKSTTNVQALTTVVCLTTSREKLCRLSEKHEELNTVSQKLIHQIWEKEQEKEFLLLSNDAKARYLAFNRNFPELLSRIPHYHVASYLGITPTQLSRIRKENNTH